MGMLQSADHPEEVTISSDVHSISIIPVFDVTGPGIAVPEYFPSTVTPPSKQLVVAQLLTVTKSYPDSVLKIVNCKVIERAPVGAMIPDMTS
jgi:hypothetical protein